MIQKYSTSSHRVTLLNEKNTESINCSISNDAVNFFLHCVCLSARAYECQYNKLSFKIIFNQRYIPARSKRNLNNLNFTIPKKI